MTEHRIRAATPDDAPAIAAVIDAAYAPWAARLGGLPDMTEGLESEIAEGIAWVAATGDRIDAVLLAAIADEGLNIVNIAVRPEAQGTGLGGVLLSVAETFARTGGADEMRLTTHRDMADTRAFYRARGWTEIDAEGVKVFLTKDLARG